MAKKGSNRARNIDLAEIKAQKGATNVAKNEAKEPKDQATKVKAKKAKEEKAKKADESKPYRAKDLAAKLGITPFRARQFLRSLNRFDDGKYTRYRFDEKEINELVELYNKGQAKKEAEKSNKMEAKGA